MVVKKLREGNRIVGTMIRAFRNPAVAQIAADAGLDFIMLDLEHGTYSIETFSDIAKVAKSIGLGIFVRVPELSKAFVSRIMDAGAEGVMVPMIGTQEEAKALAGWARFGPVGKRGLGSSCVHTNFTAVGNDVVTFMKNQNTQTLAIAQIESKEGIDNINEIAEVNGIDVLLVGPNDLAISLGVPGQVMSEKVQKAIKKVSDAAKRNKKVFAMHSGDALIEKWIPENMQMVMNSLDISLLKSGFASIVKKYKK